MTANYDHIIVGSGINALVCAALLSKANKKVLVLERQDEFGGCIKSGEIIAPGFTHDLMATTFVLFITSPAYAELADDLARHGLEFCHSETPTAVLTPDGNTGLYRMDRAANITAFDALADGDGSAHRTAVESIEQNAELIFGLLGNGLWTRSTAWLMAKQLRQRGLSGMASFFGEALGTARAWLESDFKSDLSRAMWAPWVLHTGLGPESAYSSQMAKIIAFALEVAGAPIVKGGAHKIVDAFRGLIEAHGGEFRSNAEVEKIQTIGDRASGVLLSGGETINAAGSVICSVTPGQLYQRLVTDPAKKDLDATRRFRRGKGNFQLHYALNEPIQWRNPALADVALIHLTAGLNAVSKAANEAERGMLPQTPTICVGQPTVLDPSRAPAGKAILWLQMPEAPSMVEGDAAGLIDIPQDGRWTEAVRESFADRVENILKQHLINFDQQVIGRKAYSPNDLAQLNINLEGGDPYGGYCGLDQFFIWRPFKHSRNHQTSIKNLWHIGASTHPGPGLGGGSGYLVGKDLSK